MSKDNNRPEISYLIQDILPLLNSQYDFPSYKDKVNTKIDEIPVPMGSSIKKPDVVYYCDETPVFLLEAKRPGKSETDAVQQALSYIRNYPVGNYSKDGIKPRYFGVTIGADVSFYKHRYEIDKKGVLRDWPEKITGALSFGEILADYGLKKVGRRKISSSEEFRKDYINELLAIYKSGDKITPDVVRSVGLQLLSFLEYGDNYVSHKPYIDLESYRDRQAQIRHIYNKYDLYPSLGQELAKGFRSFILRSFQGTEFNQFMTEQCVIEFMCNMIDILDSKILDFECGSGGFIAEAINKWGIPIGNVIGVDIAELPYILAKTYLAIYFKKIGPQIKEIPIQNSNGLFDWGNDYDLVISNPAGGRKYPPMAKKGQKQKDINARYDLNKVLHFLEDDLDQNGLPDKHSEYNLSIQRAIRSCKVGGRICLILPDGLFSNSQNEYLRRYIAKYCKVLAIVSLPRGAFKRGTSTKSASRGSQTAQMKMSILYAQKTSPVVDKAGLSLEGIDLSYPIFLSSIADPESTSGSIETWLGPRLNAVLEQWQSWQNTGELAKPSIEAIKTLKIPDKEVLIKELPKKQMTEPAKPKHKSTHKVDEHLKSLFKKDN